MADIFEQVDEALREDRVKTLWRRFGWMIIAGAILIVVGTAAVVGWRAYETSVLEDNTLAFSAAIDAAAAAEPAEAVNVLTDFAEGAEPDIAALARMRAAAVATGEEDFETAVGLYQAVAGDGDVDQALRDLATVLGASLSVDSTDLDGIRTQLAAMESPTSPWRHISNEIIAAAAIRAGDLDMARERLTAISDDPEAPIGLRGRAAELLAAIGGDPAAEDEAEPAPADAVEEESGTEDEVADDEAEQ